MKHASKNGHAILCLVGEHPNRGAPSSGPGSSHRQMTTCHCLTEKMMRTHEPIENPGASAEDVPVLLLGIPAFGLLRSSQCSGRSWVSGRPATCPTEQRGPPGTDMHRQQMKSCSMSRAISWHIEAYPEQPNRLGMTWGPQHMETISDSKSSLIDQRLLGIPQRWHSTARTLQSNQP